jgi:oligopeptide transport system permease protein
MNPEPNSITVWMRLKRRRVALVCLGILVFMICAAAFGPFATGYRYEETSDLQFAAPSSVHLFGTDLHGRDLFTRILYGARISLAVGLIGALVSLTVGVSYGMISGYVGGRVDMLMMRFVDIFYSLPRLVFIIVLITVLDRWTRDILGRIGLESLAANTRILLLFVGIGIMEWLTMARIVRGQVLSLKEQQFVLAAKSLGASTSRILLKHLLPNLGGIIIVYLTLTIPQVILTESLLSFLGLGIQAPQSSWGSLISEGANAINPIKIYWWLLVFPGAAMALTLLSLNLLGDHLRDILDPRTAKS